LTRKKIIRSSHMTLERVGIQIVRAFYHVIIFDRELQLASELKTKTYAALSWSLLEAIGLRSIHFIVGIILARLLLPEQFGLIGMLMIFTAVAQTLLDSGFGAALIQKSEIDSKDTNSIFYFNLFAGIVGAGFLSLISPLVASFYHQPILSPLLKVCSIVLIINALGLVQNSLLVKAIDFKTLSKVTFFASLFSGIIGVSMAFRGFGVWSLAAQQVADAFFRTLLLWQCNDWRPAWIFSFRSLSKLFKFGSNLMIASLLHAFFENIYLVVIGKLFPPAELGNFTLARDIQRVSSTMLPRVVGRVAFPVFSKLQDDPVKMKRGVNKALTVLASIHFPVMLALAVVTRPMILLVLTARWELCISYLQLLCLVGLMYPLHLINLQVLQAMGKSDLFLRLEFIKKGLIIINIIITYRWGVTIMISGQIVVSLMSYWLNAYFNRRLIDYSIVEQIQDLYPYMLAAILMALLMHGVSYLPISSNFLLLVCQLGTGTVSYMILCRLLHLSVYKEIKKIVTTGKLSQDGI